MAVIWNKTKFLGVRYREHKTRKHGGNRPDKCFSIRYKLDGHDKEESVGWSSEGVTAESAYKLLSQIRENIRSGEGPKTLAEMRTANEDAALAKLEEAERSKQQAITFGQFWESTYYPDLTATKSVGSIESERGMYNKWISPILADVPIVELNVPQVENIIANARATKRSPATLRYILTVISQLWAKAVLHEIVSGECPCKKIKKPREDNRRTRFLTTEEARLLLDDLALHSKDMHDIALLSLYTGMRAGEIHGLTWGNINFEENTINIVKTKNKRDRRAYMTNEVRLMLIERSDGHNKTDLIFPGRNDKKRRWVGSSFDRAVKRLGFNNTGETITRCNGEIELVQISDRKEKVVFHTLRHTFASWLVQAGTPLYTVAALLGHKTIEMTQRYSHLAPDSLRIAAMRIEEIFVNKEAV